MDSVDDEEETFAFFETHKPEGVPNAVSEPPEIPPSPELVPQTASLKIPSVKLQSVNTCFDVHTEVDLRRLAVQGKNCEYNPRLVNAVQIRTKLPKCTALVFRKGTVITAGSKTACGAKVAGKLIAKLIRKCGHDEVKFSNFRITNCIGTSDCGFPVDLDAWHRDHSQNSSYLPQSSPGLQFSYTSADGIKAGVQVYSTGKVCICTAYAQTSELPVIMRGIYTIALDYELQRDDSTR